MALRDRPFIQGVINRIKADRPLVGAIIAGVQEVAQRKTTSVTVDDIPHVVEAVIERMAATPEVVNSMNNEPPSQSRVVSGSAWAIIGGLGMLFTQLGPMLDALATGVNTGSKWAAVLGFFFGGGAFGGGAFAMFGRLVKGLPPMRKRLWNPFSWFAPRLPAPTVPPSA